MGSGKRAEERGTRERYHEAKKRRSPETNGVDHLNLHPEIHRVAGCGFGPKVLLPRRLSLQTGYKINIYMFCRSYVYYTNNKQIILSKYIPTSGGKFHRDVVLDPKFRRLSNILPFSGLSKETYTCFAGHLNIFYK